MQRVRAAAELPGEVDIWPEHWGVWDVFLAQGRRWRMVGGLNGDRLQGLDMTQVESTIKLMGIKKKARPQMLDDLQVLEAAALGELYG